MSQPNVERNLYFNNALPGEAKVFRRFLVASIGIHVAILLLDQFGLLDYSLPLHDDWASVEVEMDLGISGASDTSLPKAKQNEEAAVPQNMLPQLPKNFAIRDGAQQEPGEAEPKLDAPKENEVKEAQEDKPDQPLNLNQDENEKNLLEKNDALRRLALEKLRKQKQAEELQAQKSDALARLKQDKENQSVAQDGSVGSGLARQQYVGALRKAVSKHYAIPEAYNLKDANLNVIIAISVDERGELLSSKIHQPSGDEVFDQIALKALKDAVPLPRPPNDQIGQVIYVKFSPKSL